jgi:quercetin dioxygenase-like cupin family protein
VFTTPGEREVITLDSGVVWEVMGQLPGEKVDFLRITYEPGSASSSGELMRHPGTEYGFLQSGQLVAELGDQERTLAPGDAICFRSATPHRYRNDGAEPAVGIWVVIDEV